MATDVNTIIEIAKWACDLSRHIIPFSANRHYNKFVTNQTSHRSNAIGMVRADLEKGSPDRAFLNEIISWSVDLSSDEPRKDLEDFSYWVDSRQKYMFFTEIRDEVNRISKAKNKQKDRDSLHAVETGVVKGIKINV